MELIKDQKILESIVKKAWEDPIFKNNLIASPIQTLESFLGKPIELPDGKTITVADQSNGSVIFINIPANPNIIVAEDMELSEEQLDIISGGGGDGQTPPIIIK